MPDVALGRYGPVPRDCNDPRSQVLYLPDSQVIVVVECRAEGGWHCGVIARHGREHQPGHLTLTDGDLTYAHSTLTADPVQDPDLYAMLWQARVRQRWLGGHLHTVARVLAEFLRPPGSLMVDIDQHAAATMIRASHLRVQGLRRLLTRLTEGGMLTLDLPGIDGWGSYTLAIPTGNLAPHPA